MELTERERFEGNHFHLFMDIIFRRFQSSHFNNSISIMHGRMDENKLVYSVCLYVYILWLYVFGVSQIQIFKYSENGKKWFRMKSILIL